MCTFPCTFPWTSAERACSFCFLPHSLSLGCRFPCSSISGSMLRGFCPGLFWAFMITAPYAFFFFFRIGQSGSVPQSILWVMAMNSGLWRPDHPFNKRRSPLGHGNKPSQIASQLMEPCQGWGLASSSPWSWQPSSLANPPGWVGFMVKNKFWFRWGYVLVVGPQTSCLSSLNLGFFTRKRETVVTPTSES